VYLPVNSHCETFGELLQGNRSPLRQYQVPPEKFPDTEWHSSHERIVRCTFCDRQLHPIDQGLHSLCSCLSRTAKFWGSVSQLVTSTWKWCRTQIHFRQRRRRVENWQSSSFSVYGYKFHRLQWSSPYSRLLKKPGRLACQESRWLLYSSHFSMSALPKPLILWWIEVK